MASSIYAPLQGDGRDFRVLILEPSTDRLAPVRCKLNRASLDDDDLKYMALSYTWGDPLTTAPILVNGVERKVTLNLEAALQHIRKLSYDVVLWVDALCINQENETEKNHQVEMMREIYSGAELVIAWLGGAGEDSDLAMELLGKKLEDWGPSEETLGCDLVEEEELGHPGSSTINGEQEDDTPARTCEGDPATLPAQGLATISCLHLSSPGPLTKFGDTCTVFADGDKHQDERYIMNQPRPSPTSQPSSTSSNSGMGDSGFSSADFIGAIQRLTRRESLAILNLLKRSWWYRVWVIQEVVLAKKVLFKCGDAEVSGRKMSSWGVFLHLFHELSDGHETTSHLVSPVWLLELLNDSELEETGNNAVDILPVYSMREATRPHDHIYGLLGVISERDRRLLGAPDYGCKVEDLFINVATKLMKEHKSLQLLIAAGIPKLLAEDSSTKMNLPSWVPDWTRQWRNVNVISDIDSRSDFVAKSAFHFSEDMKELTFHGFELAKIESVKSIPALSQGEMPIWQSALTTEEGTRGDRRPPPLQGLVAAILSLGSSMASLDHEKMFPSVASLIRELEEYRISLGRGKARGSHCNSDYLAGLLNWIGEKRDGRADEEILEKVFSTKAAQSFVEWYHKQSSADLQRLDMINSFERNGAHGTAGFSMFRTCKGSFGIMEAAAAAGDLICAVPGCQVPLVLRRFGSSQYLLVGPSRPIYGPTDTELERGAENGEIIKDSFTVV